MKYFSYIVFKFLSFIFHTISLILVSASSSCYTLAVPMREVSCVGYRPRAWDLRSLQCALDDPLHLCLYGPCSLIVKDCFTPQCNNTQGATGCHHIALNVLGGGDTFWTRTWGNCTRYCIGQETPDLRHAMGRASLGYKSGLLLVTFLFKENTHKMLETPHLQVKQIC